MDNIEKQIGEHEQQEQALSQQYLQLVGQSTMVNQELGKLQYALTALKKAKPDAETVPGQ